MCRVDDVSRRQTGRRQTAFSECEPRAWAHAGSRAGSFRVLAGPGTTAGRSLSSRASSLASLAFCVCGRGSLRESNKKLGLALLRVGLERAFGLPLPLDLGFQLEEGVSPRVGFRRGRWGGHGFACISVICSGSPCSCCCRSSNARATTGVQVSGVAVSSTCRTANYAIRYELCSQPDRIAGQACWLASVLQTLAFCPSNSSIDSYAAFKAAP